MAGVKSLRKLDSETKDLNKVQEYTQQALDPIAKSPILNGVLLKKVKLETGKNNDINHKLNRAVQGWFVVRKRADASVWDLQDSNDLAKKTLRLRTDADVTVDLWIF